jgi:hypothetical protein
MWELGLNMSSPGVNLAFIYSSISRFKGGTPYFNEGKTYNNY